MPCPLTVDNRFGPVVKGCRDDFDFTLLFEQVIMTMSPTALVLLLILPRIYHLHTQKLKTKRNWVYWSKCVCVNLGALSKSMLTSYRYFYY